MDYISGNGHKPFYEEYRDVVKSYLDRVIEKETLLSKKIFSICDMLGFTDFFDIDERCETILNHQDRANRPRSKNLWSKF